MWSHVRNLAWAAAVAATMALPASAQDNAPIKIGVPLPLTGPLAGAGTQLQWGIQYAAKEANDAGGVLGRQLQLIIEDTKGEANTSATVAAKLGGQDKVDAVVGGFGSLPGAIVGGLVIGIVESFAGFYLPDGFKDTAPYIVVLLMLMIKPNGLFGEKLRKKV